MSPTRQLSWSRYLSYATCGLQYNLRYVKRVKRPKPQIIFLVGSVVHRAVDEWAKSRFEDGFMLKRAADIFNAEAKSVNFQSAEKRVTFLKRAVRGILLTEHVYKQMELPQRNVEVERWFEHRLGGWRFIGGVDVYDPTDGGTIYDLKMYTSPNKPDKRQTLTYALGKMMSGAPVGQTGFITPFLSPKVKREQLDPDAVEEHRGVLLNATVHMDAGVEPMAVKGSHCTFCEYKGKPECPATYTPVEVLGRLVTPNVPKRGPQLR